MQSTEIRGIDLCVHSLVCTTEIFEHTLCAGDMTQQWTNRQDVALLEPSFQWARHLFSAYWTSEQQCVWWEKENWTMWESHLEVEREVPGVTKVGFTEETTFELKLWSICWCHSPWIFYVHYKFLLPFRALWEGEKVRWTVLNQEASKNNDIGKFLWYNQ